MAKYCAILEKFHKQNIIFSNINYYISKKYTTLHLMQLNLPNNERS